ncbi:MAG: glycosyltransferase family 39 protein [Candidatus Omnitrophica bacterium]|nr:glycosyltransferase family 39 protein [Candidatus Omnitrophota bacterium]
MRRLIFIIVTGISIALFTVYLPEYAFSVDIFLLGLFIGGLCVYLSSKEDAKFLLTIFMTGYLLRIVLSLILHLFAAQFAYRETSFAFEGFFIGDGLSYWSNGVVLKDLWNIGIFPDKATFHKYYADCPTVSAYDYINGFIMTMAMGVTPVNLFFLNSLLGALSIIVIYLITAKLTDKNIARWAALLYCFWPSLVLWSTQNLKEPGYIFFVYLVIFSLMMLIKKFSIWYLLCIILSTYIAFILRPPIAISIVMLLGVFFLLFLSNRRNKFVSIFFGIIVLIGAFWFLWQKRGSLLPNELWFDYSSFDPDIFLERVNLARKVRTFGGSSFLPGLDFSNFGQLLLFLPVGAAVVFLLPFPWQIGSAMQFMTAPETFIWYILIPFIFKGFVYCFKKNRGYTIIVAGYVLIMALILGVTEGNIGTLFRHKSIIIGLCLIFAATGIHLKIESNSKAKLII